MDWIKIIGAVIQALVMGILFYFVSKAANKKVEPAVNDLVELKISKMFYYAAVVCFFISIPAIFLSFYLLIEDVDIVGVIIGSLIALFLGGVEYYLLQYYKNHQVLLHDDYLVVRDVNKEKTHFGWSDIVSAKYGVFSGFIKILLTNGKQVKISGSLIRIKNFFEFLESKTEFTAEAVKFPYLKR